LLSIFYFFRVQNRDSSWYDVGVPDVWGPIKLVIKVHSNFFYFSINNIRGGNDQSKATVCDEIFCVIQKAQFHILKNKKLFVHSEGV